MTLIEVFVISFGTTIAGGLLLKFVLYPIFIKIGKSISGKFREKIIQKEEKKDRAASKLTDQFKRIEYKIDRNRWYACAIAYLLFGGIILIVIVAVESLEAFKTFIISDLIVIVYFLMFFTCLGIFSMYYLRAFRMGAILKRASKRDKYNNAVDDSQPAKVRPKKISLKKTIWK